MAGCGRGRVIAHPASAGFCSPQVKLTTPAAHFGIDGFRDLLECQGAVRSADKNPSFRRFDVFGERLEEAATNPPRRSHPLGLPLPLSPYALRRGADIDGIRPGSQVRVGDPGRLERLSDSRADKLEQRAAFGLRASRALLLAIMKLQLINVRESLLSCPLLIS
jgi:hypothetical protein